MPNTTTIQMSVKVRTLLANIKKEIGAKSYSAAILWMAKKAKVIGASEMGSLPKLHAFKREKQRPNQTKPA